MSFGITGDNDCIRRIPGQHCHSGREIAETYHEFTDTDKYARAVSQEIEENDFNLSVTRYVDVFEDEAQVDIS